MAMCLLYRHSTNGIGSQFPLILMSHTAGLTVNNDMQNRALGLALEREKQKAAGLSAELQKTKTIGNVPMPGTSDPQVVIRLSSVNATFIGHFSATKSLFAPDD